MKFTIFYVDRNFTITANFYSTSTGVLKNSNSEITWKVTVIKQWSDKRSKWKQSRYRELSKQDSISQQSQSLTYQSNLSILLMSTDSTAKSARACLCSHYLTWMKESFWYFPFKIICTGSYDINVYLETIKYDYNSHVYLRMLT